MGGGGRGGEVKETEGEGKGGALTPKLSLCHFQGAHLVGQHSHEMFAPASWLWMTLSGATASLLGAACNEAEFCSVSYLDISLSPDTCGQLPGQDSGHQVAHYVVINIVTGLCIKASCHLPAGHYTTLLSASLGPYLVQKCYFSLQFCNPAVFLFQQVIESTVLFPLRLQQLEI